MKATLATIGLAMTLALAGAGCAHKGHHAKDCCAGGAKAGAQASADGAGKDGCHEGGCPMKKAASTGDRQEETPAASQKN